MESIKGEITKLISNGDYGKAVRRLHSISTVEESPDLDFLLATALAGQGKEQQAEEILASLEADLSPEQRAKKLTAEAFLSSNNGNFVEAKQLLHKAIEEDPSYPLSRISLARYFIWVAETPEKAIEILEENHFRDEPSPAWTLNQIAARIESKDFKSAAQTGTSAIGAGLAKPSILAATYLAWVLSTPLAGGLVITSALLALFIPYVGPVILACLALVTVVSLATLHRTNPTLIWFTIKLLVVGALVFTGRSLVFGYVFP